jgi:hypothetical protein
LKNLIALLRIIIIMLHLRSLVKYDKESNFSNGMGDKTECRVIQPSGPQSFDIVVNYEEINPAEIALSKI